VTVIDFDEKNLQVTVENEQQSLAIGKRGQNVRLAARLVGWAIDIRSEEEMKREIASQMEQMITAAVVPLSSIEGISSTDSATLAEHGIETIEQLADATVDDVSDWLDLSIDDAQDLLDMAIAITDARRARQSAATSADPDAAPDAAAPVEEAEGEEAAGQEPVAAVAGTGEESETSHAAEASSAEASSTEASSGVALETEIDEIDQIDEDEIDETKETEELELVEADENKVDKQ
jgi:N utilization substance protein A